MSGDVTLTAALRTNLNSLNNTSNLIDRTSQRLSTGKEVNSVFDDPVNFARSEGFNNRASDLDKVLDNISNSKRTVEQAQNGAESVESLIDSAESLVNRASEQVGQNSGSATITGGADLSGIDDFMADTNASAGDQLNIGTVDSDGNDVQKTVNLDQNVTIDQLVAEIDSKDGVNASLNDSGQLELSASESGAPLRVEFVDGSNADDTGSERDVAATLGLDSVGQEETDGNGGTNFAATTTDGTTLSSVQLFQGGDTAQASDDLDGLSAEDGTTLVQGTMGAGDSISFNVKNSAGDTLATASVDPGAGSIQDLVDTINNGNAGNFIQAGFDGDTGQLSITSTSSEVDGVETAVSSGDTSATSFNVGFAGFDTQTTDEGGSEKLLDDMSTGDNAVSEFLRFGAAADELEQIQDSFNKVRQQIDNAVGEAELSGTNLLNGDNLQTFFDTERTESLTTQGTNFTSAGLGLEEADFTSQSKISEFRSTVIEGKNEVRSFNQRITTDLNVIQTREDLANNTQDTLSAASDDLTLADQNEEAAKLSALQTRQQLANQSLSIAVQSQQSVLQVLR